MCGQMRLLNILAIVSVVLWGLVLWNTGQHVRWLTEESPGSLNPVNLALYLGVPATMIVLTAGSVVAMRFISRTAVSFEADYSHRLGPIPVFSVLLFLPYLVMLFIGG